MGSANCGQTRTRNIIFLLSNMSNLIPDKAIAKDEVAKHNTEGDCWIIVHGAVCDVTDWIKDHPGGGEPLLKKAGADATMVFKLSHPEYVLKEKVAQWAVGYLEGGKLADDLMVGQAQASVPQDETSTPQKEVSCFAKIANSICGNYA